IGVENMGLGDLCRALQIITRDRESEFLYTAVRAHQSAGRPDSARGQNTVMIEGPHPKVWTPSFFRQQELNPGITSREHLATMYANGCRFMVFTISMLIVV